MVCPEATTQSEKPRKAKGEGFPRSPVAYALLKFGIS